MSLPGADVRQADNKLHDGTPNKANSIDIDLSSYSSVGTSLNNVSFKVNTPSYDRTFVLTTDTSKNYRNGASKINISGCTTAAQVADKIKALREQNGFTQSDLAKKLGITRSSVNAWEMGISVPSTQYVVELANIFKVSTDFLLGVKSTATVNVEGLSEKDVQLVNAVIAHLREKESAIIHQ